MGAVRLSLDLLPVPWAVEGSRIVLVLLALVLASWGGVAARLASRRRARTELERLYAQHEPGSLWPPS